MLHATDSSGNSNHDRWRTPAWNRSSPEWIALRDQLPHDHLAHVIDKAVDSLDLTPLRSSYAGRGSLPYPPELLLRVLLFELYTGVLSPAQWAIDCRERIALKVLLFGAQPSRSCLYDFRDRIAPLLEPFNSQVLKAAVAAGVTTATRAALDGTFVAARGSRHRLIGLAGLERRIEQLQEAPVPDPTSAARPANPQALDNPSGTQALEDVGTTTSGPAPAPAPMPTPAPLPKPYWMARTARGRMEQLQRYRHARTQLLHRLQENRANRTRSARAKRRSDDRIVICPSEPQAALGRDKMKVFRPLYNVQWVCDLDSPLLLGYEVVPSVTDAGQLGPAMASTARLCGHGPQVLLADEIYASHLDLALCQQSQIVLYSPIATARPAGSGPGPLPEPAGPSPDRLRGPGRGLIPKSQFEWVISEQTYRCPEGHLLKWVSTSTERRRDGEALKVMQYRCAGEHCRGCPLKHRCTRTPESGRVIKRSEHEDLAEALQKRMEEPAGQQLYRLRKQTIERHFADMKEHRGLRRFAGFGPASARTQVGLLVLAVNLVALHKLLRMPDDGAGPHRSTA